MMRLRNPDWAQLAGGLLEAAGTVVPGLGLAGKAISGLEAGGRGGSKGVNMIDASTGLSLGRISRKKALRVLQRRGRYTKRQKAHIVIKDGEKVITV
jgi:hypothetical protein